MGNNFLDAAYKRMKKPPEGNHGKDNTTIVNGHGEKANIQDRVAQIKNEIENTKSA